jgi:Tfp pilus assembly protein PilW
MKKIVGAKCFKRFKSDTGSSLLEVLVTLMIFSIIIAAINATLLIGDSSWNTNSIHIELQQELRKSMDWMKDDLRQTGASAISDVPANGTWYTAITFQKTTGVSGGSITWDSDTTRFILGGSGADQLQRIEGLTTTVIAQSMQSVRFRRLAGAPDIVEVALQAQRDTFKGATITSNLNFKVQLRN